MNVSVIIPVYNAADYVGEAVQSALAQPQVLEVLLAEDGSTDDSLAVCRALSEGQSRVKLIEPPEGRNGGASVARNRAVAHARGEVVAFLDADDRYLPGRFDVALDLLAREPQTDGVYEALEAFFMNEEARREWFRRNPSPLTTLRPAVTSDALLGVLLKDPSRGHFHLDGLTVRRAVFDAVGQFKEGLPLAEDTHWCLRLAALACLQPGRLDVPVAERRLHGENTIMGPIYARRRRIRLKMWQDLFRWARCSNLPADTIMLFAEAYLCAARVGGERRDPFSRAAIRMVARAEVLFRAPRLVAMSQFRRLTPPPAAGAPERATASVGKAGLISVVIPTYNRSELLVSAMASVHEQGYRPIELLIVDDGSTDTTEAVVSGWAERVQGDAFDVRFLRQPHRGAPAARNRGKDAAGGEFLLFLDSDCRVGPQTLQQLIDVLQNDPELPFAYGTTHFVDETGGRQYSIGAPPAADRCCDAVGMDMTCIAPLWRMCFLQGLEWHEGLTCLQDWAFKANAVLRIGCGRYVSEASAEAVIHEGDRISNHASAQFREGQYRAILYVAGLLPCGSEGRAARYLLARRLLSLARASLRIEAWQIGRQAIEQAARLGGWRVMPAWGACLWIRLAGIASLVRLLRKMGRL